MMASCDAELPVAQPQENEPQPALTESDIVVKADGVFASGSVVDLNNYTELDELLPVYTLDEVQNLPEGAVLSLPLELAGDADFSKVYTITPEEVENNFYVTVEQLNDAHIEILGPNAIEKTVYYRIPASVNYNGVTYRVGSSDYYALEGSYQEICVAGSAYEYLTVPFNVATRPVTDWNQYLRLATYDYVTYFGTVHLYGTWFLSAMPDFETANFMQAPDTEPVTVDGVTTGEMVKVSDYMQGTRMSVKSNGLYYVTVDVLKLTYELQAINSIQLIGGFNGWSLDTAVDLSHASGVNGVNIWTLKGQTMPAGEYKFCVNRAWTLSYGGAENDIVQNGGNLNIAEDGTYDFELDFSAQPAVLRVTKK